MIRLTCFAALLVAASNAQAVVLYDGALGTPPTSQGLTYVALPPASVTTAGGATTLDTTASNAIYAGFGTNAVTLDRGVGFSVRLDAQLVAETHTSESRAGFSLLVLSSDLKGIELGFHLGEIFAQNDSPLFVRAEDAAFVTTAATRYDLDVIGSTYTLRANGGTVLTGPLRDYTAFVGLIDPYETPNSIFLGDDTTSASGSTRFSYVAVNAVPEPATLAACLGVSVIALRRRRD